MNYYTDVLKRYAVFSGRARRKEYWMFVLFNAIASIIASILDTIFKTKMVGENNGLISSLYSLAVFIPTIAVGVRRLHDTNRKGWWMLLPLAGIPFLLLMPWNVFLGVIPAVAFVFIGTITVLIFNIQDSTPGDNKYGPNPKGVSTPTVTTPV